MDREEKSEVQDKFKFLTDFFLIRQRIYIKYS